MAFFLFVSFRFVRSFSSLKDSPHSLTSLTLFSCLPMDGVEQERL